jgi:hypothetical protein
LIGARLLARVLLEWPKDRAKRSSNHKNSLC